MFHNKQNNNAYTIKKNGENDHRFLIRQKHPSHFDLLTLTITKCDDHAMSIDID
jgi:hypothetical protein